ncbi:hypothetical protein ACFL0H_09005, partial [Thermodesulfobacteriota bacterium]
MKRITDDRAMDTQKGKNRRVMSRTEGTKVINWTGGVRILGILIPSCTFLFVIAGTVVVLWGSATAFSATNLPITVSKGDTSEKEGERSPELPTLAEIQGVIKDLKEKIRLAELAENEQKARQIGVTLGDLQERTTKSKTVLAVSERLQTALKKKDSIEEEETSLRAKVQAQQEIGVTQKPPYALSFYDILLDESANIEQQQETTDMALKLARRSLEGTALRLDKALKHWRGLKDQLDSASEKSQGLEWGLEKARLEKELTEAVLEFEKVNHYNLSKQFNLAELQIQLSRRKIDWVRKNLYFDETDLTKQLARLSRTRTDIEQRIQELIRGRENAEDAWLKAQREYGEASGEKPDPTKKAYLEERDAWRKTYQTVLEQTEDRLSLLGYQEQVWRLRYAIIRGEVSQGDLVSRRSEIENHLKNLERELNLHQSYQLSLQSQIIALEKRASEKEISGPVRMHLQNQINALHKLAERLFEHTSEFLTSAQLDRRILSEMAARLDQVTLKQRFSNVKGQVRKIWDFEIWVIDNHAVTVRKLIVAMLILLLGILTAK